MAVCGTFHYRHYVRYLSQHRCLGKFYYSHRLATDAASLGVRKTEAVNLCAKEYLTHLHLRTLHHRLADRLFPRYQDFWQRGVLRYWNDPSLLHVMLHGAADRVIRHAKNRGVPVIGEPVNSHPEQMQTLLREEYDRLGLPGKHVAKLNSGQRITVEEAQQCDQLLVPSTFIKRSYVDRGFDESQVTVLPWGTDLQRFSPQPRAKDGIFRVMCVSQIAVRKGHVDLLEAWKQLALPSAELVFLGSVTSEMQAVLDRYSGLFKQAGHIAHSELPAQFAKADVVVQPSIEDGFSYVPLEAMACGRTVIVSENTGASELVKEGKTGFVVPIRNPEAIASRLLALYDDRHRCEEMGNAASNCMRVGNDWKNYAGRLVQYYQSVSG